MAWRYRDFRPTWPWSDPQHDSDDDNAEGPPPLPGNNDNSDEGPATLTEDSDSSDEGPPHANVPAQASPRRYDQLQQYQLPNGRFSWVRKNGRNYQACPECDNVVKLHFQRPRPCLEWLPMVRRNVEGSDALHQRLTPGIDLCY